MNNNINYILHLADSNLIHAQRLGEWCAHGPILEQDIAITNITLDLIGQSRNFYQYAAQLINDSKNNDMPLESAGSEVGLGVVSEDSLAYLRTEREFKNLLLTELPNGDWAQTITKLFFFSVYQYLLYEQMQADKDEQLAAIAAKSLKEITYHVKWSGEWVIRLGDGTADSHERMVKAVNYLWMYTGEMFENAPYESVSDIDKVLLKSKWDKKIEDVFSEATLAVPGSVFMQTGGKEGKHTEHLGFLLAELQYLQRTYPGAEW
jgi:ring-1,2-phenylacetyl-CoA epoxidase subunit PaaC